MQREERFFRIGEAAALVGVPIHTLRYWESVFASLVNPHRSKGGQRRYSVRDIERIGEIKKLLKEEGYSINGANRLLQNGGMKKVPVSHQEKEPDWSLIAQEVTDLIQKRLSDVKEVV